MTIYQWATPISGDWTSSGDWNQPGYPDTSTDSAVLPALAGGYTVSLVSGDPLITVAALSITYSGASFNIAGVGGAETVLGNLVNDGNINIDDEYNNIGGSTLNVDGTLSNSGNLFVDDYQNLVATSTLAAASLINTGLLQVTGNSEQVSILIGSAAGFGTAGILTGQVELYNDVVMNFAGGGQIGTIAGGALLQLYGGAVIDNGSTASANTALTGLTLNAGQLEIENDTISLAGNFTNTGRFDQDDENNNVGGSKLLIAGTLTNSGGLYVGDNQNLVATSTLATASLINTGLLQVTGNSEQVSILIGSAAGFGTAGILTGQVELYNDVLMNFAGGGQIGTIAVGAQLQLYGGAVIDNGSTASANTALTGLTLNAGELSIADDTLTVSGNLTNSGEIDEDDQNNNTGGSTFSVAGTLTNSNNIFIGVNQNLVAASTLEAGSLVNTGLFRAQGQSEPVSILIGSAAGFGTAGILTGQVELYNDVLMNFAGGGQVGTIASGAQLQLYRGAVIDNGSTASANTALTGLTLNAGELSIADDTLTIAGNLTNTGEIDEDDAFNNTGGSTLTVAGTLTNSNNIYVGVNQNLVAASTLAAASLVNTGLLRAQGQSEPVSILIGSAAGFGTAGILTGQVELYDDVLMNFAGGGQVGTIASGAQLQLYRGAVIDNGSTASANTALTGLTLNAGELSIADDTLTIAGNLTNTGEIDEDDAFNNTGGSTLTIAGTLTNSNNIYVGVNQNLVAASTLAAASVVNTGLLRAQGQNEPVSILIGSAAGFGTAGILTGQVELYDDVLMNFAGGGQVGTIASGAQLQLYRGAVIDNGSTASANTALTALTLNAGELSVANDTLTLSGNLTNTGQIDEDDQYNNAGGATISVGGTLTNSGNIFIGLNQNLVASTTLEAASLVNTGQIQLQGIGAGMALVQVSGNAGNSGNLIIEGGGTLNVGSLFTQTAGLTEVIGQFSAGTAAINGGDILLQGGTLGGATLHIGAGGSLVGAGTVADSTLSVAGTVQATGLLSLDTNASGNILDVESGATLALDGNISNNISLVGTAGTVDFIASPIEYTGRVLAAAGSADEFIIQNIHGTSATYANGVLTVDPANSLFTINVGGGYQSNSFTIVPTSADETIITFTGNGNVACFARGTRIRTSWGEVAVEDLFEGAPVVTRDGVQKVIWIGRRRLRPAQHKQPAMAHPIRISASAFAEGVPLRDLYVSPEHAIFCAGVLIPARCLVNGTTIVQVEVDEVVYYHIELPRHDVLYAEGLAAESWLDTGSRAAFENADCVALHPDFRPDTASRAWAEQACATLVEDGPVLARTRRALAERAYRRGPAAHELVIDVDAPGAIEVSLPPEVTQVRLRSRAPSARGADRRKLGCAIDTLSMDDVRLRLDDERLAYGFHPVERDRAKKWRWTDGNALIFVGQGTAPRRFKFGVAAVASGVRVAS